MKVLIWITVFFIAVLFNTIWGMASGFQLGSVLLYAIAFFTAKKLCKWWDKRTQKPMWEKTPEGWYTCPTCGRLIRIGENCSNCTRKSEPEDAPPEEVPPMEEVVPVEEDTAPPEETPPSPIPQPTSAAVSIQYCHKCGAPLLPEGSFCNRCGVRIIRQPSEVREENRKSLKESKAGIKNRTVAPMVHCAVLFVLSALFLLPWVYNLGKNGSTYLSGAAKIWYKVGSLMPLVTGIVATIGGISVVKRKAVSPISRVALWFSLLMVYLLVLILSYLTFSQEFILRYEAVYALITLACEFSIPMVASYFLGPLPGASFAILPAFLQLLRLVSSGDHTASLLLYSLPFVLSQFLSIIVAVAVPFLIDLPAALSILCSLSDAILIKTILNMVAVQLVDPGVKGSSLLPLLLCLVLSAILHTVDLWKKRMRNITQ